MTIQPSGIIPSTTARLLPQLRSRHAMAAGCWLSCKLGVCGASCLDLTQEYPGKLRFHISWNTRKNLGKILVNHLQLGWCFGGVMAATGRNFSIIHEKIMPCRLVCMCPTMDLVASLHADGQLSVHRFEKRNTRFPNLDNYIICSLY